MQQLLILRLYVFGMNYYPVYDIITFNKKTIYHPSYVFESTVVDNLQKKRIITVLCRLVCCLSVFQLHLLSIRVYTSTQT